MNKLSITLFLTILSVIPTYSTPEQKTASTIAASLLATVPSALTRDAIVTLITNTQKQANEYALDEQTVLKELTSQIDAKIQHYQQLVDRPKNGYWQSAKSFGIAALLALISYLGHYIAFREPQKIEDEIYISGVTNLTTKPTFFGTEARITCYPSCDKKSVERNLNHLAFLYHERPGWILISAASGLLAVGGTLTSITELREVICAKTYLKKYQTLKSLLEKEVTNAHTSNPS